MATSKLVKLYTLHPTPHTPHPAPTNNFFSKPYVWGKSRYYMRLDQNEGELVKITHPERDLAIN
ncbi:MAG: hypothetical protein PX634_11945 [Microcystis sp. M53600_WE12]|nr:hypothetical protein [Microcystis sp. M53600_WE12]